MIFDTRAAVFVLALAQWASAQGLADVGAVPSPIFENVTSSDSSSVVVTTPAGATLEPPVTTSVESPSSVLDLSSTIDVLVSSITGDGPPASIVESSSLLESTITSALAFETSSIIEEACIDESYSLLESTTTSTLALETSSIIQGASTAAVSSSSVIDRATSSSIDSVLSGVTERPSIIIDSSSVIVEGVSSSPFLDETASITEASSVVAETAPPSLAPHTTVTALSSAIPQTASSTLGLNVTVTRVSSTVESTLTADRNLIFPNATVTQAVTGVQISTVLQLSTITRDLGNNITMTSVITNELTVTAPPLPPATETVQVVSTQIIQQPTVIIVQQITFFVFQSALGAICPAVQPAPGGQGGQGGFIVGGQTFPQFQQACLAACNIQLNRCQTIVGPGIQLTQCQSQFIACQGAAATATVTVAVPATITQTMFLPPAAVQTEAPAVTSQIVEGGGQVIGTTTLASDAIAAVGPSGDVKIITVTAIPAPPAAPTPSQPPVVQEPPAELAPPQLVTSVVTVTIDNPARPGVPLISTATLTLQHPTPSQKLEAQPLHTSVVTITVGQQTGVITMTIPAAHPTSDSNGSSNESSSGNSGSVGDDAGGLSNNAGQGNGNQGGCEVCQAPAAPVTVTETRVLTEMVSFCAPSAASTNFITETVSASAVAQTQSSEALPQSSETLPPVIKFVTETVYAPPAVESEAQEAHVPAAAPEYSQYRGSRLHRFESYFDGRRKRGLPHHRH